MPSKTLIKCFSCGVFNENSDYCSNCGELISYEKKKAQRIETEKQERLEKIKQQKPSWIEHLQEHPFFLYKAIGWMAYSVAWVVGLIGAFLAWFAFAVASG